LFVLIGMGFYGSKTIRLTAAGQLNVVLIVEMVAYQAHLLRHTDRFARPADRTDVREIDGYGAGISGLPRCGSTRRVVRV
jgi:hypothetical protein